MSRDLWIGALAYTTDSAARHTLYGKIVALAHHKTSLIARPPRARELVAMIERWGVAIALAAVRAHCREQGLPLADDEGPVAA